MRGSSFLVSSTFSFKRNLRFKKTCSPQLNRSHRSQFSLLTAKPTIFPGCAPCRAYVHFGIDSASCRDYSDSIAVR